ncbi:hypothetical protein [Paraferrimonas haliotis]|uniref:Uncharacterized protein n=1 Tax=Paraferrimonas haliotis TaxID=2013866 RepID=A0AA37TV74_9GAMM|nr:hypothetical protein [Paraferrimonas haliotis]GLS83260.1 hypothetical protein GCM10007894_12370 [Paraferrimonas haliotis]
MIELSELQERILSFVMSQISKETFVDINENVRLKYSNVDEFVDASVQHIPKPRLRAQMRRYLIDDAFADSSPDPSSTIKNTTPKGEFYTELQFGRVTLSHVELTGSGRVRKALHRSRMAAKNASLEGSTIDMFDNAPLELDEMLHLVLITVHPEASSSNQGIPEAMNICVPFSDWEDYHLIVPLSLLINMYDKSSDVDDDIHDGAWPTLKTDMLEREKRKDEG